MAFIPADKMKALREAALNGDERAKKIINAHFKRQDYAQDLEDFFAAPKVEEEKVEIKDTTTGTGNEKLDYFLASNNISKGDPDYEDALEDYYREFPNERPKEEPALEKSPEKNDVLANDLELEEENDMVKDIGADLIELISKCDQMYLNIIKNDNIDDTSKKGAMSIIREIKDNIFECAEKMKKVKSSLCKEKENDIDLQKNVVKQNEFDTIKM